MSFCDCCLVVTPSLPPYSRLNISHRTGTLNHESTASRPSSPKLPTGVTVVRVYGLGFRAACFSKRICLRRLLLVAFTASPGCSLFQAPRIPSLMLYYYKFDCFTITIITTFMITISTIFKYYHDYKHYCNCKLRSSMVFSRFRGRPCRTQHGMFQEIPLLASD